MQTEYNVFVLSILAVLAIILTVLLTKTLKKSNKKQLDKLMSIILGLVLFWIVCSILQILCTIMSININLIYFDYATFISVAMLPVSFLLLSITFTRTRIKFNIAYLLLFIIPVLTIILMWTNNSHHLLYEKYSTTMDENVVGPYFYIHYYYTLLLYVVALLIFMKYSVKNSGLFSRQAVLIFIGVLVPLITNFLGFMGLVTLSIYSTPITFAFTIICVSLAISRFSLLTATPIALQRIVDRISDSYIVLNESYEISDFNETFVSTFNIENQSDLRGTSLQLFLSNCNINTYLFNEKIENIKDNDTTESFELYIKKIGKYFNVEITSIIEKQEFLGILILFKDISQHIQDMKILKSNQETMMENERLASLGQLIGGIAHNLKTPIMSIAGAAEGLNDLIKEYDASIGDPEVNNQDHHEIAHDMNVWVDKIKGYTEYMSDIITTVKGQAVTLGTEDNYEFTVKELINRVDILMRHELKNALVYLNVSVDIDENTVIHGDINSLVQVINNIISNSIQAYNGKTEQSIEMKFFIQNETLIISLKDYAGGLPESVKNKLFKEMVTTKGKNGTGLGLYMSYSNIKARFNGDITFETDNKGTTFNIILPL